MTYKWSEFEKVGLIEILIAELVGEYCYNLGGPKHRGDRWTKMRHEMVDGDTF